jgi:hypothetical protein
MDMYMCRLLDVVGIQRGDVAGMFVQTRRLARTGNDDFVDGGLCSGNRH